MSSVAEDPAAAALVASYPAGAVVRYASGRADRWCREGYAIAEERRGRTVLVDTYWGRTDSESHVLTAAEVQSASLLFRLDDYDEIGHIYDPRASREATWERYAPEDRRLVTSQHGLQGRYFVRQGAQEDHGTQVANAARRLEEARDDLRTAQRKVEWAERDLAEVQAEVSPPHPHQTPEDRE